MKRLKNQTQLIRGNARAAIKHADANLTKLLFYH